MVNNEKYLELINKKFGKYQLLVSITVVLTVFYVPILVITLPMMQQAPNFKLSYNATYTMSDKDTFCKNVYFQYDFDHIHDLIIIDSQVNNWSSELKIVCFTKRIFSLVGTIYFLASIASYLSLSKFPDRYGRVRLFKYLNLFSFIALLQMMFLSNYGQIIVAAFVTGISALNLVISSVILNENIDSKYTGLIIGISMSTFPLGGLLNTLFMYIFEDWRVFFLLTLVLMAFNTYIILFYLKESPKWLLANNKIDQYLETIRFIAKFNGDDNILSQMKTSPILSRNTSNQSLIAFRNYNYSITDLFTYKSLRLTTICGIYIWIVSGFSFYGLLLSLENFTGNIYLDSIVAYTAEFIAEIGSGIIADRYGRKPTILISFLIGSSCGLSLIVSNTILNCVILFVSCIGVAAAFNILYIYSTELYPTNVKSLAVSVFFVFSRLAATIVPYMLTVFPNVTLLICVSSIIAAFVMVKLPETLGSQIGDEIEEMKDNIFDDKVSDSSFNYVNLNNVSN